MSMPIHEFEFEALPELESEYEGERESEFEGEYESEEFLANIANLARRGWQGLRNQVNNPNSPLRNIARGAARGALSGAGGALLNVLIPEKEFEEEFELEVNPIRRVYRDALMEMEHLGHAATRAHTEAEAEAFIGSLIPLAARIIPRAAPAIMRVAPNLIRGISGVTQALRRNPTTRPLLRILPTVARNTAVSIARQVAQGQRVTPQTAVRTLARQTAHTLSHPQRVTQAWRRSQALDRRYHHNHSCVCNR